MNREQKATVVDEVAAQIQESEAVFAVDYRGISVQQVAELRRRLGEADATLRVVKNTLTERAADKAGAEALKALLDGPTAFTFVHGDAAMAAKAIATFRREHSVPDFKGGTMDGAALSIDELQAIALLPGRDVLHGQLVGVLASPVTGIVRGLNQLIQGLALQLGQIAEQGLVSGEAAPAAEQAPATADAAAEGLADGEPEEAPADGSAAEAATAAEEASVAPQPPAEGEATQEDGQGAAAETASGAEDAPAAEAAATAVEGQAPAAEEDARAAEASGDEPADNDENEPPAEGDEEAKEG